MRRTICAAITILAASASADVTAAEAKAMIASKCARDWPNDYTLQKFCQDSQAEAAQKIALLQDRFPDDTVERGILDRCMEFWTGADLKKADFVLSQACFDGQIEALRSLQAGAAPIVDSLSAPRPQATADTEQLPEPLAIVRGALVVWVFFLVLVIVLSGIGGAKVFEMKRRSRTAGFWLGFLVGPVGVLIGLLLPMGGVKCLRCGEPHDPIARSCPHCGADLAAAGRCRHCGKLGVPEGAKVCPWCEGGSPLSSEEATAG